jgi:DNA-binding response OmpR family regulator
LHNESVKILVVDDEPAVRESLRRALQLQGYQVALASNGADALEQLGNHADEPDAVILDVLMPEVDGLTVCRRLRLAGSRLPVLMLTARTEVDDRVAGLDAGADDYLIKPFAMAELVARTKALLRRPGGALGATLKAGNVVLDTIGRDVRVADRGLALTRREIAILEHLMRRAGRVVPKTVLEDKLYGVDDELESNAIPVHVHHLRRKLTDNAATIAIHTVRGIGYLLVDDKP